MLEEIKHGDDILAIILKSEYRSEGITFFTPDTFSQQLAYMRRPEGYSIPPHVHNTVKREVLFTKEVLLIRSGKVRVDFYTEDKAYLKSRVLTSGDIVLLAHGGHGFVMLEESEIIEVKQGPYAGEADKTRFTQVSESEVRQS